MGTIDVKEMKIDRRIPKDSEQPEKMTPCFCEPGMGEPLTEPPLLAFNLPGHSGSQLTCQPREGTAAPYKTDWGVSAQREPLLNQRQHTFQEPCFWETSHQ